MKPMDFFLLALNFCFCLLVTQQEEIIDLSNLLQNEPFQTIFRFSNISETLSLQNNQIIDKDLLLVNEYESTQMDFLFGPESSLMIINQSNVSFINFHFLIESHDIALNLSYAGTLLIHVKISFIFFIYFFY